MRSFHAQGDDDDLLWNTPKTDESCQSSSTSILSDLKASQRKSFVLFFSSLIRNVILEQIEKVGKILLNYSTAGTSSSSSLATATTPTSLRKRQYCSEMALSSPLAASTPKGKVLKRKSDESETPMKRYFFQQVSMPIFKLKFFRTKPNFNDSFDDPATDELFDSYKSPVIRPQTSTPAKPQQPPNITSTPKMNSNKIRLKTAGTPIWKKSKSMDVSPQPIRPQLFPRPQPSAYRQPMQQIYQQQRPGLPRTQPFRQQPSLVPRPQSLVQQLSFASGPRPFGHQLSLASVPRTSGQQSSFATGPRPSGQVPSVASGPRLSGQQSSLAPGLRPSGQVSSFAPRLQPTMPYRQQPPVFPRTQPVRQPYRHQPPITARTQSTTLHQQRPLPPQRPLQMLPSNMNMKPVPRPLQVSSSTMNNKTVPVKYTPMVKSKSLVSPPKPPPDYEDDWDDDSIFDGIEKK